MSYYDPYTGKRQSFHAEQLYEMSESTRSRTLPPLSASPAPLDAPPALAPNRRDSEFSALSFASPTADTPSGSTPPSQRRRLTKPRPTTLLSPGGSTGGSIRRLPVPPNPSRTGSSSDDSGASTPPNGAQVLFRAPPLSATLPGPRMSTPAFSEVPLRDSKLSYIGQYDYSLPPTADAEAAFLLNDEPKKRHTLSETLPYPTLPYSSHPPSHLPKRKKGLFEAPPTTLLLLHCSLCAVAWPAIYFMTPLVRASLFWTRAYVGVLCSAFGIPIGFSLLELIRRWLEAAAWATVIHQSEAEGGRGGGVRMAEVAEMTADATSAWVGIKILWKRVTSHGLSRKERASYDRRPWSLFILFFLVVAVCEALLTFTLGRIVNIDTAIEHQYMTYEEQSVPGDLSPADVLAASNQRGAFESFVSTWTLAPFASSDSQAPATSFTWEGDKVYFAEATREQLGPDGIGRGTFELNTTESDLRRRDTITGGRGPVAESQTSKPGVVLRYPKWGVRIHCEKLPEPEKHLIPLAPSNSTYVLLPRTLMDSLFASFDMDVPEVLQKPMNWTFLRGEWAPNDTLPEGVDEASVSAGGKFWNNGVAHSLWSLPLSNDTVSGGWTQLETVLVRLNETYTPEGKFPMYGDPVQIDAATGQSFRDSTRVGYDAAVCLEVYESWVVDTAWTDAAGPTSLGIKAKGSAARDAPAQLAVRKGGALGPDVAQALNSTDKFSAFLVAHDNSVNQIIKDNGRDQWYVPSPTIVSFTDGAGPRGYTSLSAEHFGAARARADAANVLPYLAGRGQLLARSFDDHTVAWARVGPIQLAVVLGVALVLGLIAGCCTPRLPGNVPRRDTGMWGWVAVLVADGVGEEVGRRGADNSVGRSCEVEQVSRAWGGVRVRYRAIE